MGLTSPEGFCKITSVYSHTFSRDFFTRSGVLDLDYTRIREYT